MLCHAVIHKNTICDAMSISAIFYWSHKPRVTIGKNQKKLLQVQTFCYRENGKVDNTGNCTIFFVKIFFGNGATIKKKLNFNIKIDSYKLLDKPLCCNTLWIGTSNMRLSGLIFPVLFNSSRPMHFRKLY